MEKVTKKKQCQKSNVPSCPFNSHRGDFKTKAAIPASTLSNPKKENSVNGYQILFNRCKEYNFRQKQYDLLQQKNWPNSF